MARAKHTQRTAAEQASRDSEDVDARREIESLEAGATVPNDPRDWPTGKAKFLTFGSDSDEPYGEGPTAKLGPAGVEHHQDGSVSVGGKVVANPQDFKGEPIPGGPTDPNTPQLAGERGRFKRAGEEDTVISGHHTGRSDGAPRAKQPSRTAAEQASRDSEDVDARREIETLEAADTVPRDPMDWPTGRAKFLTFGSDSDEPYGEGPTAKLGPAGLVHHQDGSVSVGGKTVDNPQDYKGRPIGKPLAARPTDRSTPQLAGEHGPLEQATTIGGSH